MAKNPTKVESSPSEHLGRSCLERGVGGASHRWWGALCFPLKNIKTDQGSCYKNVI
ncbi:MAG TPA: hypothetical protein P5096_00825 [Patescibacteria group bacterium]|nr:hypothetical protein [Patescibacteria group bacterium]